MIKSTFLCMCLSLLSQSCSNSAQGYASYDNYPTYESENLWLDYTPERTIFSLWSPVADVVLVHFYAAGFGGEKEKSSELIEMKPGLWRTTEKEDLNGKYYTFQVKTNGQWLAETPGIYAMAVGVNGQRAMVMDLSEANPEGWQNDAGPVLNKPNEAIIYELHVRDITTHPNAGGDLKKVGKFLGLVEAGMKGPDGLSTGLDHMKELGITHVHLLPAFDNYSINEEDLDRPQFNWGYDPQNFNVPEGSFSSDPYSAEVRIAEFKQMVNAFHQEGIGVILDVVYNHTGRTDESNFNLEVPGYYFRLNDDGTYSNASGCGNETASERTMMRKYIVESVSFWAKEYHLDGFRFDLMGIHDIETMNAVSKALYEINPNILIYGEGWTSGSSPLPEEKRAHKKLTYQLNNIAAFSDDIRDGLKGSVFDDKSTGFVSGAPNMEASIKFGVVGSTQHPQIDYKAVNYSDAPWANEPWQAISYASCHDNHTLYDKLKISLPDATESELAAMQKLANAVVLTSQGIPFLHAGVEMMRTKGGEHNSFESSDAVNQIDWSWKVKNANVYAYHRVLIQLRKNHPAFFLKSAEEVQEKVQFLEGAPGVVAYKIVGPIEGEKWNEIVVVYNARKTEYEMAVDGPWNLAVEGDVFNENGIRKVSGKITVPALSMMVAFRD